MKRITTKPAIKDKKPTEKEAKTRQKLSQCTEYVKKAMNDPELKKMYEESVQSINDNQEFNMENREVALKYGKLLAKFLRYKTTPGEDLQLDDFVNASDENMNFFEHMINPYKQEWVKKWFKAMGISIRGIRWEQVDGWYKRENFDYFK
jgi:hypothetical protein